MKSIIELTNMAALMSEDVVTVQAQFRGKNSRDQDYSFLCSRALAGTLEKGDYVIGGTKHGAACLLVVGVDDTCDIEPDRAYRYNWVFQKLDTSALDRLLKWQDETAELLMAAQRRRMRESMLAELGVQPDMPVVALPDVETHDGVEDAQVTED